VESASAFGITQAEIATQLKISEPTLRKHFRDELSSGKFKVDMIAGNVKKVWLLARRGSLEATMSFYLVERIKAQPNIEMLTRSEVTALEGCDCNLETARWRHCGRTKAAAFSTERALVSGRHIFGGHFTFPIAQTRDARALYEKWS
jgi:hypothetical protein